MSIRNRVLAILDHFKLKQTELAEYAGVKKQAVTKWLNGSTPGAEAAILLRERLGVNDDWLINGRGEMLIPKPKESDDFTKEMIALSSSLTAEDKLAILGVARNFVQKNN